MRGAGIDMEVEIYAMKLAQNPIEKWGNIAVIV
jgi:hypothetical protein